MSGTSSVETVHGPGGKATRLAWGEVMLPVWVATCLLAAVLLAQASSASAASPCGGEDQRSCCRNAQEGIGSKCRAGDDPLYPLVAIPGCGIDCKCDGAGTSAFTCVQPTECGGPGQRACCVGEPRREQLGGPCESGLAEIPGCVGDCFCREGAVYESNHTCSPDGPTSPVSWDEGTTGWTAPEDLSPQQPGRSCPLLGYADIHAHLMSHLAHGGGVFYGDPAPIDPDTGLFTLAPGEVDIRNALENTGDAELHGKHRLIGDPPYDPTGNGTNDITGGGAAAPVGRDGWPTFNTWPHWTSTTHQQMYYKWLERAWRGGMRLMVQLAVTNEALCIVSGVDAETCAESMDSVDRQIVATYDFERFIDEEYGGENEFADGKGWFKIVYTPMEARQAIAEGKMAVVLGIEMDNLFNCKEGETCPRVSAKTVDDCLAIPPPTGEEEDLRRALPAGSSLSETVDWYYDCYGIRHVFPIHNFDNAFGATATWQNAINVGQRAAVGRWQNANSEHQTDENITCESQGENGYGFDFNRSNIGIIAGVGFGDLTPIPTWPGRSVCNTGGLNLTASDRDGRGLAATLLDALMDRGMIIDIDHMSIKSFDQTVEFAEDRFGEGGYPLVAGHVQFFDRHGAGFNSNDVSRTFGRHERMRTRAQLEKIRASGGMIAAMTKDDQQDADDAGLKVSVPYVPAFQDDPLNGVIIDVCRHSSTTFGQGYQYAVDTMRAPVALGIDFNGIAGHVGPRFGSEACGNLFDRSIEQADREDERSAEILLSALPEGAQAQLPFKIPRKLDYDETAHGFILEGFGAFARQQAATRVGGAPLRTWDFNVDGLAHAGLVPDLVADLKVIGLGERYLDMLFNSAEEYIRVWERSEDVAGVRDLPELTADLSCDIALCEGEDTTGPPILCPAVVQECEGVLTSVEFAPEVGEDYCGGVVVSEECSESSPASFSVDTHTVTCTATDDSENASSCSLTITVQDTTSPFSVTPPPDIPDAECTSPSGTIVALGSATAMDLCDPDPALSDDAPSAFPLGSTTVIWTATDDSGNEASAPQVVTVVDTTPPSIACPAPIVEECTGNHQATVTPGAASGSDACSNAVALTTHPTQVFDLGTTGLAYVATDEQGLSSSCTGTVTVVDTTPPSILSLSATPDELWPPDAMMEAVTVDVESVDVCDASAPVCSISSITSNQPSNAIEPDWVITGPLTADLRRERTPPDGGDRVYTIEVHCEDEAGLVSAPATTTVIVPRDGGGLCGLGPELALLLPLLMSVRRRWGARGSAPWGLRQGD